MYYTIATLQECHGGMTLDICKNGNKYTVGIYKDHVSTTRNFDELTDAYKVYEKLASWIIFGYYSDENRREYLRTGTMK